jgi:eukaryotic-like serine/threonine-protein kinase
MLTKMGAKLLDFGLAKPTVAATVSSVTISAFAASSPVTEEGTIFGTFQYMSPEQIEGRELDGRSDIFSFGAVLYEMITGKRAFEGKSQLSVASAIIEKEPAAISDTKPLTPPALDHAVRRCLAKDPEDRWQTARDLAVELKWLATPSSEASRPVVGSTKPNRWLPLAVAALALVAVSVLVLKSMRPYPSDRAVLRASILPPEKAQFASIEADEGGVPAVSPNGRYLVVPVHEGDGKVRLWLRTLRSGEGRILSGTEGSGHAFWSPDSRSIAFFAGNKLRRIDIDSSAPYTLCDAALGRGGTWNSAGIILFAPALNTPLYRVQASGGTPVQVTKFDTAQGETGHRWPQFLPDGRHFLFIVRSEQSDRTGLYAGSLDSPEYHLIVPTIFNATYVAPGYLLYSRDELLFAQKFDPAASKLSGEPFPLPDHVGLYAPALNALFSASDTGVLAYYPAVPGGIGGDLGWYDRSGKRSEPLARNLLTSAATSPDGNSIALSIVAPNEWTPRLWKLDLQRGTKIPLTSGSGGPPVWMPDGQSILYSRSRGGVSHIYRTKASGDGREDPVLVTDGFSENPLSICSDGKILLFARAPASDTQQSSLWALPLTGEPKPFPLLQNEVRLFRGVFSPDCNWVAYESGIVANREIFIVHFPDGGRKYQVSTAGGFNPKWRRDGKEFYFYSPQDSSITAVPIQEKGQELILGKPMALFSVHPYIPRIGVFDVAPDGQKFLIFGNTGALSGTALTVVMNWDADLSRK